MLPKPFQLCCLESKYNGGLNIHYSHCMPGVFARLVKSTLWLWVLLQINLCEMLCCLLWGLLCWDALPSFHSYCLLPVQTVVFPAALVSCVLPYSVSCLSDLYTLLILVLFVGKYCVCSSLFQFALSSVEFFWAFICSFSEYSLEPSCCARDFARCWLEARIQPWRQPWFLPLWSLRFSEERYWTNYHINNYNCEKCYRQKI